eukprot:56847-Chlamydomonas_euryale.AAC.1
MHHSPTEAQQVWQSTPRPHRGNALPPSPPVLPCIGGAQVRLVQQFQAHAGVVWTAALNASGTLLATGGQDGVVKVWSFVPTTDVPCSGAAVGAVDNAGGAVGGGSVVSGSWPGGGSSGTPRQRAATSASPPGSTKAGLQVGWAGGHA